MLTKGNVESFLCLFLLIAYFQCGWYKQRSTKTIQGHNKRTEGPDTCILKLLKLKHDFANVSADSKESMCLIIKCNTVTSFTKYVSISLIQLTKRILRTLVLKTRERILRRICFEMRKCYSTITDKRSGRKATCAERFLY